MNRSQHVRIVSASLLAFFMLTGCGKKYFTGEEGRIIQPITGISCGDGELPVPYNKQGRKNKNVVVLIENTGDCQLEVKVEKKKGKAEPPIAVVPKSTTVLRKKAEDFTLKISCMESESETDKCSGTVTIVPVFSGNPSKTDIDMGATRSLEIFNDNTVAVIGNMTCDDAPKSLPFTIVTHNVKTGLSIYVKNEGDCNPFGVTLLKSGKLYGPYKDLAGGKGTIYHPKTKPKVPPTKTGTITFLVDCGGDGENNCNGDIVITIL